MKPQKQNILRTFLQEISLKRSIGIVVLLIFGPFILAVLLINLTGANILDGLFGIYNNTPFQKFVVSLGVFLTLAGPLIALVFSILFATIRSDLSLSRRFIPLTPIILILTIVIIMGIY